MGKRETPAERSFYARGMGVFLMRVVYGKKRYGKLYERILECVEPETKQYDLVFDFFGFGAFTTAFGARKTNARKKAVWFHGENLWWLFRTRDFIPEYDLSLIHIWYPQLLPRAPQDSFRCVPAFRMPV